MVHLTSIVSQPYKSIYKFYLINGSIIFIPF